MLLQYYDLLFTLTDYLTFIILNKSNVSLSINNPVCGKNYMESVFSILRKCFNCFDVI